MNRVEIILDEELMKSNCCECAKVVYSEDDGKKRERLVTIGSLMNAITNSFVRKRVSIDIGKIPFGYYTARVGEDEGKLCANVITVLPASRQIMKYEETSYDVCLPSLVFQFTIERERIYSTYVYVMKDKKPADKSRLYRYPFGNVDMTGHVCWGSNVLPSIKELQMLESVMMLFIQSPGNADYFNPKEYCGHKNMTLRQLFEKLKDEESYPENYLVAVKKDGKNMLLKDLMTWKTEK